MDEKFIKLTVREDETSKLKQLARLREENLKKMYTHTIELDSTVDEKVKNEFRKLKTTTKVDMNEEPLVLLSLLKESQILVNSKKKDKSKDETFDLGPMDLVGHPTREIGKVLGLFNMERQINQKFNLQVAFFGGLNSRVSLPTGIRYVAESWESSWE